ncbi:PREDICTED: cilia- and flagella-associated protein 43-like [Ceratosolen solmsi marchali]|uniref:Cilia- and flagella-associated protein 43-like n=1 Tax=Ceratosolen solmsi marchali TaxID=326594 RepID=A0AAJ6YUI6_9HYME|nr:PREDICTED: cilia- and flagella-associated protein 43-like [Ceratosolen solmsi marchali]
MSTAKDSWRTIWLRGGRISEVAWISQDALAWCSGIHLVFFDLPTKKLLLPRFSYDIGAAGASCLSGHPRYALTYSHKIFAFAEKHLKPRIFVYTYPSMIRLCECVKGTNYAYLATAFVGDFLVSLGSRSDFKLTIWLWRTGEKIINVNTFIYDAENYSQSLKINSLLPSFIAQDVLAIVDNCGCIYLSNAIGSEIKCIVLSKHCNINSEIVATNICWYSDGIILCTTIGQMNYYKKNANWSEVWSIKCVTCPLVLTSHPMKNDRLFFITINGHIVQINCSENDSVPQQNVIHFLRGKYLFVDFLEPLEEYIVAIDTTKEFSVIEINKGIEITSIKLNIEGNITVMLPNPKYPLVAICTSKGEIVFVSCLYYYNPKILGEYILQMEILDLMKFSSSGRYLVVCQKTKGICYLLILSSANSLQIHARLDTNIKILDIMLFEIKNNLKLYILEGLSTNSISHQLLLYELDSSSNTFKKKSNMFVGTPYVTKQLRFFTINDMKEIICFDIQPSGHKIRQAKLFYNRNWLITSALDGLIIIRKSNPKISKNKHIIIHHRHDISIAKATINSTGDLLITLGVDGSIIAMKCIRSDNVLPEDNIFKSFYELLCVNSEDHKNNVMIYMNMLNKKEIEFLSENLPTYIDSEEGNMSWNEWKQKQNNQIEEKQFMADKGIVLTKLKDLKSKINDLINKNEVSSELEKLPMSAFALNKTFYERYIKSAKDKREEIRCETELNCLEMERVTNWILNKFWKSQRILSQSIFSIFDTTEISNYTISIEQSKLLNNFEHAQFTKNVFKEFMNDQTIYPWETYTASEINLIYNKQLRVEKTDEISVLIRDSIFEYDDEPETIEDSNYQLLEGVSTYNFLQQSTSAYSQFKTYSFSQLQSNYIHNINYSAKLRFYFNKLFDEMYIVKQREMNLVSERINRIHHICSELQLMFNIVFDNTIKCPEWNIKENPKTIIEITENEMSVKPYISPSIQELYNKQAMEQENARLAMLADDFRERAIQTMMDGMLEIRWEDLIKNDPPKPMCLVRGKRVEDYTDEDNLMMKRYEQSMKNIEIEREKYRKQLQINYVNIHKDINKGVEKFNSRLEETNLLKMKIESAIQQLNLHYVRGLKKHFNFVKSLQENDKIKKTMIETYQSISRISHEMNIIEAVNTELYNKYDTLIAKDKYMEKKFKNDFPTLGNNAIATIFVQYKKRPRTILKSVSNFEILDLGKSIVSMRPLSYLTPECLEYFKQVAILDNRPKNLPSSIDSTDWKNVIALRRLKIDHELKLCAIEICLKKAAEVLKKYNQKVSNFKLEIESMKEQQKQMRMERIECELNTEVQLVIKMGQVETTGFCGDITEDFTGVIVIPRVVVERINEAILAAGKAKLSTIRRNLNFKHVIEEEQWNYDCLRSKVRHLQENLYFVKTAHITRDIRDFLTRRSKKLNTSKTPQKLKKEIEMMAKNYEKIVKDYEEKLKNTSEEVLRVQKNNEKLDEKITRMNVRRCEMELKRDIESEMRHKDFRQKIVRLTAQRSALVKKLLENYEELMEIRKRREIPICTERLPIRQIPKFLNDKKDNSSINS